MDKNREEFIKTLTKENPDMKVLWIDKTTDKKWPSEKQIDQLTRTERNQFNLRKQLPCELILDIEERHLLTDIKLKLDEYNWSYEVWDTGSRGIHISIKFSNLADNPRNLRERIKKHFIKLFETDDNLSREAHWIALEYTPHFKTGKLKLKEEGIITESENTIPKDIIEYCEDKIVEQKKRVVENKEIIKDYHKNDPYLKYALTTTIENGDRDTVLFKNLAIGLVKSGLPYETIEKYATRIASNCPGKTASEFMGWVDKVIRGELVEYNKSELKQWSVRHGHPVLYKLESDEDPIDLMSIKQLWDEIWNHKIACQPVWKDLCFYNLIGTILDEKEEDYRVHVIFSSPSGSGKDEGINIIQDILERLQYKTAKPTDITDRTLIGSINQVKVEFNVKHGLDEDNPEKGKYVYQNPIDKGLLSDLHWLAFGEAEVVLKPGSYNKKIQVILRQVADKSRRIEKGVGGVRIPIVTNTSFILTTYEMDSIMHSLLHNGLFQRALFYRKVLTQQEHEKIRMHISKSGFGNGKNTFNEKKYIGKFLEKLKIMKKWYEENKSEIKAMSDMDILVENLWKKFESNYREYMIEDKDILNSLVRRYADYLRRLAVLNSVWNMKAEISKESISECFKLILTCVLSIQNMIFKKDTYKKRLYVMLQIIARESISKGALSQKIEEKFSIKSSATKSKLISQMVSLEYANTFKNGRYEMLTLTQKGKDYLLLEE